MADSRFRRPQDPERERARWRAFERGRPSEREPVGPGEESVWDFPRPPRLEPERREVQVALADSLVAVSRSALRVCETASPPTVYVPPADVQARLVPSERASFCEWKGHARYWHVEVAGQMLPHAAWSYPEPEAPYALLRDHVAFYPALFACTLDGETVRPQEGAFYGGWITGELRGPFKGAPGTEGW
jgi:uncharacterized protein (DUF427 family)